MLTHLMSSNPNATLMVLSEVCLPVYSVLDWVSTVPV